MALQLEVTYVDGRTVRRTTSIGVDLLTMLPDAEADTHEPLPPAVLHERRRAGLAYAWERKPTPAMRKRMRQSDQPYVHVVADQIAEYERDQDALVDGLRRHRARVLHYAEHAPIGRAAIVRNEMLQNARLYSQQVYAVDLRPAITLQCRYLSATYQDAANLLLQRMWRAAREAPRERKREYVRGPLIFDLMG